MKHNNSCADFSKKYHTNDLSIYSNKFWSFSIRPKQTTFGSLLLFINSNKTCLSQLSEEESNDLGKCLKIFGIHCKENLNAKQHNISMLMLVDLHLHFHLFPRYENNIFDKSTGILYDNYWPKPSSDFSSSFFDPTNEKIRSLSLKINDY